MRGRRSAASLTFLAPAAFGRRRSGFLTMTLPRSSPVALPRLRSRCRPGELSEGDDFCFGELKFGSTRRNSLRRSKNSHRGHKNRLNEAKISTFVTKIAKTRQKSAQREENYHFCNENRLNEAKIGSAKQKFALLWKKYPRRRKKRFVGLNPCGRTVCPAVRRISRPAGDFSVRPGPDSRG